MSASQKEDSQLQSLEHFSNLEILNSKYYIILNNLYKILYHVFLTSILQNICNTLRTINIGDYMRLSKKIGSYEVFKCFEKSRRRKNRNPRFKKSTYTFQNLNIKI